MVFWNQAYLMILFVPAAVAHRFPSGPTVIDCSEEAAVTEYSANSPKAFTRPILSLPCSTNQTAESGPMVMPLGLDMLVGMVYSANPTEGTYRAILLAVASVNQMELSAATPNGPAMELGASYSVIEPSVVLLAILFTIKLNDVTQRLPSGPVAISSGLLLALGIEYSVTVPLVVIFAIREPADSANQRLPSGPAVMPWGARSAVKLYSVNEPDVVTLPILLALLSVNQRLPSGPATMS